ncbi:MAG: PAS domain-containing protein [Caldisericia bacterium]|nr:PAS domain-containing protein [Caldisericia bacterium]
MEWFQLFSIVLYAASSFTLVLMFYTWKQRKQPGGIFLFLMLFSITIWMTAQATEFLVSETSLKILFSKISYIGALTVAVFFYECIYSYIYKNTKWNRSVFYYLLIIPCILLFFVATDGTFHNLVWRSIDVVPGTYGNLLIYKHGVLVYVAATYSYMVSLATLVILFNQTLRTEPLFRYRYFILIIACLLPFVGNILYLTGAFPMKGIDFTVLGFSLSSILLYLTIYKLQFLNVKPIAYDFLFQHVGGYIIVLDEKDRVISVNPSAQKDLSFPKKYVGKPFSSYLLTHPTISQAFQSREPSVIYQEVRFKEITNQKYTVFFEFTKKDITVGGSFIGTLIRIDDITHKIVQRRDLKKRNELQQTLIEISHLLLSEEKTNMNALKDSISTLKDSLKADMVSIVRFSKKNEKKNETPWSTYARVCSKQPIPENMEENSSHYPTTTPLYNLFDIQSMDSIMKTLNSIQPYIFDKPSSCGAEADKGLIQFLIKNNIALLPITFFTDADSTFLWGYVEIIRKNTSKYTSNDFTEAEIKMFSVLTNLYSEYMLRRKVQRHLISSKERFEQVSSQAREVIWEIDENKNFVYLSDSFYKVLSFPEKEKLPEVATFRSMFLRKENKIYNNSLKDNEYGKVSVKNGIEDFREIFNSRNQFKDFLLKIFDFNGNLLYFLINAIPVFNNEGEFKGYRGSAFDITLIKQLEIMKDSFINTVSHEFRTPLFAIRESINIVKKESLGEINPMQKNALDISLRNTDRLVRLINDILDYQKFQSGRFKILSKPVTARSIIQEAFFSIAPLTDQKGLLLQKAIAPDCPKLMVDKDMIVQVLINLLSNGLKFTSKGGLMVKAYPDYPTDYPEDKKNVHNIGYIHFEIQDSGIGIKEDDMPKLFHTFSQISSKDQPKTEGTGLGLVISKRIMDLHNGRIWVESVWKKGTTFHILLPIATKKDIDKYE